MRILSLEEFLKEPDGTVFMNYESAGNFGNLSIKGETTINSYYFNNVTCTFDNDDILPELAEAEESSEKSVKMDFDTYQRDDLFIYNEKPMFAVYEKREIENLIRVLSEPK